MLQKSFHISNPLTYIIRRVVGFAYPKLADFFVGINPTRMQWPISAGAADEGFFSKGMISKSCFQGRMSAPLPTALLMKEIVRPFQSLS